MHLVRARDELDRVGRIELRDDVAAKQVARAARAEAPPVNVLRVAPHEVAHRAVVWHLLLAVDHADLVQSVDGRREPTVHAKDLRGTMWVGWRRDFAGARLLLRTLSSMSEERDK